MAYRIYLCGPRPVDGDPDMEYDGWRGLVPKDMTPSGRSKTHRQVRDPDTGRYRWVRR